MICNIGAIVGGLFFGSFSQSFGRRKTMILVALLALPVIYFWALWRHGGDAGAGRLPDAGLRAGRLGRGAGASERTVAGRCARHLSPAPSISWAI